MIEYKIKQIHRSEETSKNNLSCYFVKTYASTVDIFVWQATASVVTAYKMFIIITVKLLQNFKKTA